jgi:hypothetical protein
VNGGPSHWTPGVGASAELGWRRCCTFVSSTIRTFLTPANSAPRQPGGGMDAYSAIVASVAERSPVRRGLVVTRGGRARGAIPGVSRRRLSPTSARPGGRTAVSPASPRPRAGLTIVGGTRSPTSRWRGWRPGFAR